MIKEGASCGVKEFRLWMVAVMLMGELFFSAELMGLVKLAWVFGWR